MSEVMKETEVMRVEKIWLQQRSKKAMVKEVTMSRARCVLAFSMIRMPL